MKNFTLIGAAGFIAPRHMKAIKETGNNLVAAIDRNDSVGIIDSYFPEAEYFTEFEPFEAYLDDFQKKSKLDYVSICTPNYLHSPHIRFGLKTGADVICEKPLVLNAEEAHKLLEVEKASGKKVFTILQLRYHQTIIDFRNKMKDLKSKPHIVLTYITSRGNWYHKSWKAEFKKSGGVTANIGIHFFDMLIWTFGSAKSNYIHLLEKDKASGFLELENANVSWYLSIDSKDLPEEAVKTGKRTYRSIMIGQEELEFSEGFTDLHTVSYQNIFNGNGYGILEALPAIEVVEKMNTMALDRSNGELHPFVKGVKIK
jgi:UDP-N-acetyl-2-amino-2-deoxyglucuronate dehydrogenase